MKRTLLILFVAAVSLVSCKKDPEDKLKGRWDLTKEFYVNSLNGTKVSEGTDTYKVGDFYIVFDGNKYNVYDEGDLEDSGTFTATENSITLKSKDGDSNTGTLRWNSKSEFVLITEETDNHNGDTYVYKYEMTFNKH